MNVSRQAALVRSHLYAEPHLTSWQAEGVYRIRRLASRISELKLAGYAIDKATKEDATGQRYTRYSFTTQQRRRQSPVNPPSTAAARISIEQVTSAYSAYCTKELFLSGDELTREVDDFINHLKEHIA